jgi:hypothetical protein
MIKRQLFLAVLFALVGYATAQAQGVQTGELTGTVRSSDGLALPGATVTIKSPALQGTRSVVSDTNGSFIFKGLPPGPYTLTFEMSGMGTVEQNATVALGGSVNVTAAMSVASVQETIVVTADSPSVLSTPQAGANYTDEVVDSLASSRTLAGVAELAPGLTDNTPNAGQVTISGGFAYDNVFLVDGVDVNDNVFGQANNLFIEDAVEETQVLTSGISAEYGRFSGGVINAVTKRGGNEISGSFRTDLTNSGWTDETPFEERSNIERSDNAKTNKGYQATLGGPIVKDRLWFFLAGRKADTETARVFPDTGIATTPLQENDRIEAKLSGTITPNHTLQGTYIRNSTTQLQPSFGFASSGLRSIDPATIDERTLPNDLFVVNYNGILRQDLFLEAQYSQKKFRFEDNGGSGNNIVNDSPFLTLGVTTSIFGHYNAPFFDANDPEDRDNRQIAGALSYFLSTGSLGRHDIKGGFESFRSTLTGGNSQSPTGLVFYADYAADASGTPLFDADNRLIPVFVPGESLRTSFLANRGAELDITTNSFFLNDKWQINDKWSANLGVRYERVRSEATGGIVGVDTDTLVPRLALSYDVKGDGKYRLDATYSHYAGKYNEAQIGGNTEVGNPSYLYQVYVGPAGQGLDFAAGFDDANYETFGGVFPTANVFFDPGLSAPLTREYTIAAGMSLGQGGYLKAIYANRSVSNFIEDFIEIDGGTTNVVRDGVDFGTFDNSVFRNSDLPVRDYQALQLQAHYRLTDRWDVSGHYTYQLKNEGNFEGENTNQPAITSLFGNYPELHVAERNFPVGRLNDFQRHKVRAWTTYDVGLGRVGNVDLSVLWRYDSALTYSLQAASVPFSAIQLARDPGYASLPNSQPVFFGGRGTEDFEGAHLFDLAVNYSIPVFKSLRPYVKFQLVNALNNDKLTSWNTTVTRDANGPVDQNGIPTAFIRGSSFGQGTGNANYPQSYLIDNTVANARAFSFSLGFRF